MDNKKPPAVQVNSDEESTARNPHDETLIDLNQTEGGRPQTRQSRSSVRNTNTAVSNETNASEPNNAGESVPFLPPLQSESGRNRLVLQYLSQSSKLKRSWSSEMLSQQVMENLISSRRLMKRFNNRHSTMENLPEHDNIRDYIHRYCNTLQKSMQRIQEVVSLDGENTESTLNGPVDLNSALPLGVDVIDTSQHSTSAQNDDEDQNETGNSSTSQQNNDREVVLGSSHDIQPHFHVELGEQTMDDSTNQDPPAKIRRMIPENTQNEEDPVPPLIDFTTHVLVDIEGDSSSNPHDKSLNKAAKNKRPMASAAKQSENKSDAVSTSESLDLKLNQALLTLLECPVCLEWMEPPMVQCRRGHLICVVCRVRIPRCPVCRASFTSVRNRAIEQVAEKLRYPCRYACGAVVLLKLRSTHEASCQHRLYSCLIPECAGVPESCQMPYNELWAHHQERHPELLLFNERNNFNVDPYNQEHRHWIVFAHKQMFHVKFSNDNRNWGMHCSVAFIGPRKNAKKYVYKVKIAARENSREQTFRRETHNDSDLKRSDCFIIPIDNALQYVRNEVNPVLPFTILIQPNPNIDPETGADCSQLNRPSILI